MQEVLKLNFLERDANESQEEFILRVLQVQGYITRNFCLARYISRLGARISDLKRMGYNIRGENYKANGGLDYRYDLMGGENEHSRED